MPVFSYSSNFITYAPFLIIFDKLFQEYTPLNLQLFRCLLKDEKVKANLEVFLAPSPALTIPSPALIIPFLPVNTFPNKLAPNVPN